MHTRHIEQVTSARLLEIIFQDKLSFDQHVTSVPNACSKRSYIMKLLRDRLEPLLVQIVNISQKRPFSQEEVES